MAKRVKMIGHAKATADNFVGLAREITINTTDNAPRVHDGATAGGFELARADMANVPAGSATVDGKLSSSQASDLDTVVTDFTAHKDAASGHPNATGADPGFMSAADKSKLDGIESGATADQSAAEILASLITVDGSGSGLDADTLDGQEGAFYASDADLTTVANALDTEEATTLAHRNATGTSVHGLGGASIKGFKDEDNMASNDANSVPSQQSVKAFGDARTLVGEIKMWAGVPSAVPAGWAICDGQELSRSTYSALFAITSTVYGVGNGTTTFNLPDFRGKSPLGVNDVDLPSGADGAFTTRNEGDTGGEETHVLTESEMPSHDHSLGTISVDGSVTNQNVRSTATTSTGGDQAHNTMHPFLTVNFIIFHGVGV